MWLEGSEERKRKRRVKWSMSTSGGRVKVIDVGI